MMSPQNHRQDILVTSKGEVGHKGEVFKFVVKL